MSALWYLVSQIIKIKKELAYKKVETPKSEQDERNKCLDRRKLGSVYIRLRIQSSVLLPQKTNQLPTKLNIRFQICVTKDAKKVIP